MTASVDETVIIIPARMNSSRYPGKPIAKIYGISMVEHVWRRAALVHDAHRVFVATCDRKIKDVVETFGGQVVMTSDRHTRALERVSEAASTLNAGKVVMVQGDEPAIPPSTIANVREMLGAETGIQCVNAIAEIDYSEEVDDPDTIKVAVSIRGHAVYFSRSRIPSYALSDGRTVHYKQVCVMGFTRSALECYSGYGESMLEKAESVDMLRFVDHGIPVYTVRSNLISRAVDRPADLSRVEKLLTDNEQQARIISEIGVENV